MRLRLVEIGEEGGEERALRVRDPTILGRDPELPLAIEHPRVSRRHAAVRALDDADEEAGESGWILVDLGSANGTRLNGGPVRGSVGIRPGDVIRLADAVELRVEEAPELPVPPGVLLAAGAALVAIALAGALLWWGIGATSPHGAAYRRAAPRAAAGLEAWRSGEPARAKRELQSAAGLLFRAGVLDEVPRHEVMSAAMERLGERIGAEEDLERVFQDALASASAPPPEPGARRGGGPCRLDRVAPEELDPCLREWVGRVLHGLRQDPLDVPEGFYREVGARLRRERVFIARALERGEPIVPMLRRELRAANMPELLHYLALVESGYRTDARSGAGALGLWQFMPDTARRYGLSVGGGRDERRDPRKATRAAARYLRDLAFEFGGDALLLALAGYNRGENGVRRALKKLEDPFSDRSYWRLVERDLLPEETDHYVPRFLAAAVAGEAGLPPPEALAAAGY